MDQKSLVPAAARLRDLLERYSVTDTKRASCRDALPDLLGEGPGREGDHADDWRDIPGAWFFTEGSLAKYADLAEAYARFKIEFTGWRKPRSEGPS